MITDHTIRLIAAIAQTTLREFTQADRYAYLDAAQDARIGEGNCHLAEVLCEITDQPIMTEQGCQPQVLVSDDRIEVHATTPDGEMVAVTLDIGVGL